MRFSSSRGEGCLIQRLITEDSEAEHINLVRPCTDETSFPVRTPASVSDVCVCVCGSYKGVYVRKYSE